MSTPTVPLVPASWTFRTEGAYPVWSVRCTLCALPRYALPVKALAVEWTQAHNMWHRSRGH